MDRKKSKQGKKKDGKNAVKRQKSPMVWVVTIFGLAVVISATFSFLSQQLLGASSLPGAFLILLVIIAIGVLFDIIGVAATSADERPFHSMASRKLHGAREAIRLLRSAGKVSSICNDVVGDICGIISGAAAAAIAAEAVANADDLPKTVLQLLLSALVAGLTIGGKAFGKIIAIEKSTSIVFLVGKLIYWIKKFFGLFARK